MKSRDKTCATHNLATGRSSDVDLGPLFDMISDFDDDDLLQRIRAMAKQLPGDPLSRLADLPSCIAILQEVLDLGEEKEVPQVATLDEMRETLQSLRHLLVEDLEKARHDFETLRQQLV